MEHNKDLALFLSQRVEALIRECQKLREENLELAKEIEQCHQREIQLIAQRR